MIDDKGQLRFKSLLILLIVCACLLSIRLVYLFLVDSNRFPINTVKIAASYDHITRKELAATLSRYLSYSFFSIPTHQLHADLAAYDWAESVAVERVWPETIKITLVEKSPVAIWNEAYLDADGKVFNQGNVKSDTSWPILSGPENQQLEVLQIYQKLSKLLANYHLEAISLQLRDNQSCELVLANGVQISLGKQDIEQRLLRFCEAYAALLASKPEQQLVSVDLRYARGMAVQWK